MKVVWITDLHFVPRGRRFHGLEPRKRLEACIAHISAEHSDADLAVITGDLAAAGQHAAYQELREALRELRMPYRLLLGNGDHRERFRVVFPDMPVDENGFVQSTLDTPAGRLIFLDTLATGSHHGELCEKRLDWLRARIAEAGGKSLHLFMHHPPLALDMSNMDAFALRDADELMAVIQGSDIRHIFFGHVHRVISGTWQEIPFSVLPALVTQVAYAPHAASTLRSDGNLRTYEPPMYGVVLLRGQDVVVHYQDFLNATPMVTFQRSFPIPDQEKDTVEVWAGAAP